MKIAIKHRTNDCKDYMGSHTTVIIENLKEHKTLLSSILFVRRIGLGYTVDFLRRDVTARSRGGGRRWCKQLSGLHIFLKKRLQRSTRLAWRDKMPASSKVVRYEVDEEYQKMILIIICRNSSWNVRRSFVSAFSFSVPVLPQYYVCTVVRIQFITFAAQFLDFARVY